MEDMIYHSQCVARQVERALLMVDMPFMSYSTSKLGVDNAGRLMKEGGAHMVKLEGGQAQVETVKHLTAQGIPVCAHLGLQPQSVHKIGGYRVQGRDPKVAKAMLNDAVSLQDAGADLMVLECVPETLATEITAALEIPVIGIGAGPHCDGQVLVLYDVLGISVGRVPKFAQNFLQEADSIPSAIEQYAQAVRTGRFPLEQHWF
jgi:3-methyl-2-oxobutanoate hydroxymethyltransferase